MKRNVEKYREKSTENWDNWKAEVDELEDWLDKKIETATKGSYLTLEKLVELFNTEFTTRKETNVKQMAGALHRLGFKYLSRKKAYLSRKFANPNLEKLRKFRA